MFEASGPDEDSLWQAFQFAEATTNCDVVQGAEFSPDQDLFAVQFSYFSIGVLGVGYAFMHNTPQVFIIPQHCEPDQATAYPSKDFLDQSLEDFAVKICRAANDFCAEFEADKWGPDGPPTKPVEDVK